MASNDTFTTYRDHIHASLPEWPEFSSLNRFLQTSKPAATADTKVYISDFHNDRLLTHQVEGSLSHLQSELGADAEDSRLRFVILCHTESWSIDRDVLDVVCSQIEVEPRVLASHLDYPHATYESHYPPDLLRRLNKEGYPWDLGAR